MVSQGEATARASRLGQQLALILASALRTAAYYEESNVVMRQASAALMDLVGQCTAEQESISVGVHSHCVFVDKGRVPTTGSTYERFALLANFFERWKIGEMIFHRGLTEKELLCALRVMSRSRPLEDGNLSELLAASGVEKIKVEDALSEEELSRARSTRKLDAGSGSFPVAPILVYTAALQASSELGQAGGRLEPGMVRRVRHVTQAVVDEILRNPGAVLALTTIKDYDRYLIMHSTNVAVLATFIGQRLGLDRVPLGELCLSGFLHDAGKLGVDPDVLQKPGALDDQEWEQIRRHPLLAAYALLGGQRLTSSNMRAVVTAFEHHLNYDLSGYPRTSFKDHVSLFGNIVSIADRFDALTTPRVYRKVNLTPPEGVVHLLQHCGTHFDPLLVKLFIRVMGLYPPGTAVVLTGGEAGVVSKPPAPGAPLDRPSVRVIVGPEPGVTRDLTERCGDTYARSILAVLNPSNKGQLPAVDPEVLRTFEAMQE